MLSLVNTIEFEPFRTLDTSVDSLIEEFEQGLKPAVDNYSRRLVEFCCSKTIKNISPRVGKRISDGSISRFTYDMMLAWQNPSTAGSEPSPVWISFLAYCIVLSSREVPVFY
ncbi:hypothetical protein BHM03_00012312 [Ensete ventricosum]|nr:hypothetical protein BHM03_00012312 [Ensete ventricosum]